MQCLRFSTKEEATIYGTIFWTAITVFRSIPSSTLRSTSQKLKLLCLLAVFGTVIGLLFIHNIDQVNGTILSAILYGISNSVLFALCYTLCKEFNMKLKPSQGSDFMLSASLGDGTVVGFAGYMISVFGPDALFYSMGIFNFLIWCLAVMVVRKLLREFEDYGRQREMEMSLRKGMINR